MLNGSARMRDAGEAQARQRRRRRRPTALRYAGNPGGRCCRRAAIRRAVFCCRSCVSSPVRAGISRIVLRSPNASTLRIQTQRCDEHERRKFADVEILVRSARSRSRSLRAAAAARSPRRRNTRQGVRAFRRRHRVDLSPDAGDRASHGRSDSRALGVAQGDKVLSWLPNGPDAIRVWFGLNYLGAVYVPINLAYRGGLLAHVVANSDARLIVAHADLLGRAGRHRSRGAHDGGRAGRRRRPTYPASRVHPAAALDPPTATRRRSRARSRRGTCRRSSTPRARPARPRA